MKLMLMKLQFDKKKKTLTINSRITTQENKVETYILKAEITRQSKIYKQKNKKVKYKAMIVKLRENSKKY